MPIRLGLSQLNHLSAPSELIGSSTSLPPKKKTAPEHRNTSQPNGRSSRIDCKAVRNCCQAVVLDRLINFECGTEINRESERSHNQQDDRNGTQSNCKISAIHLISGFEELPSNTLTLHWSSLSQRFPTSGGAEINDGEG